MVVVLQEEGWKTEVLSGFFIKKFWGGFNLENERDWQAWCVALPGCNRDHEGPQFISKKPGIGDGEDFNSKLRVKVTSIPI